MPAWAAKQPSVLAQLAGGSKVIPAPSGAIAAGGAGPSLVGSRTGPGPESAWPAARAGRGPDVRKAWPPNVISRTYSGPKKRGICAGSRKGNRLSFFAHAFRMYS